MRLGRSRFKPNLSIESTQRNRLRRISGSFGASSEILGSPLTHSTNRTQRTRTISNSSATSEKDSFVPSVTVAVNSNKDGQKSNISDPER